MTDITEKNDDLILIVDDTKENLQVLGNVLRENKYKIALANNGSEALAIVSKRLPDLILLDIMMPDMDGFEVCRRLKADERTNPIPVIFLTAKTEIEDIVKGFQLGGIDYITKPFKHEELIIRVKTHVELKKARDLIIAQNEKLALLNKEKNNFLSIAAHDLKNPITAIKGFSKIIEDENTSLSQEEIIDFSKEIRVTSESMFQIVVDLLDINAIEEGKINLTYDTYNVDEFIQSKIDTYRLRASEKNIVIHYNTDPDEFVVYGDLNKAGQVLENLLSNALKFSPFNKNIWVGSKRITEADGSEMIEISVKDEGPGLTEEDKSKLFGKFAKLSARPTNEESSTGLGLSIVKRLAEAMGGTIRCESVYGEGASFIFTIPVKI
jgi:signal transduction histidine kinase